MKSDICKNRDNTAGRSIDIQWHVCLGDTSVQLLHELQEFMSETGQAPESLPDRIIFASMFIDITNWESQKVQNKCLAQATEVALTRQDSDLVIVCFCAPGSEKTWKCNEERPSHQFADGEWDKLCLRMTSELVTSKDPVFKCSNTLQTGALMKRKKGG